MTSEVTLDSIRSVIKEVILELKSEYSTETANETFDDSELLLHHVWIAAQIERERARTRLLNSCSKFVVQWSIPAVLTWMASHLDLTGWHWPWR